MVHRHADRLAPGGLPGVIMLYRPAAISTFPTPDYHWYAIEYRLHCVICLCP